LEVLLVLLLVVHDGFLVVENAHERWPLLPSINATTSIPNWRKRADTVIVSVFD
jgi:hypothetical protein